MFLLLPAKQIYPTSLRGEGQAPENTPANSSVSHICFWHHIGNTRNIAVFSIAYIYIFSNKRKNNRTLCRMAAVTTLGYFLTPNLIKTIYLLALDTG
jgi:hypothetical protein